MPKAGVHKKGTFFLPDAINKMKNTKDFRRAGAIAIFVGVVRGETLNGMQVQNLVLEAYEEKANDILASICSDLKRQEGIVDVQIHHMLGKFNVGEDLVYVLVAGSHRKSVYQVLEQAVERYKKEAPIFKKEYVVTAKGRRKAYWVATNGQ